MLLLRHTVVSNSENPPKIRSPKVISRVFSIQVSAYSHNFRIRSLCALPIQNFSNRCRHKYDLPISRFFFESHYWRVLPNCAPGHSGLYLYQRLQIY
jgi:hypothetical protein